MACGSGIASFVRAFTFFPGINLPKVPFTSSKNKIVGIRVTDYCSKVSKMWCNMPECEAYFGTGFTLCLINKMPTKIRQCLLVLTLKLEDHTSEVV